MIRIFKLVVLLVISQVAFGQAPSNYTNINGRYRWIAGMFDSTFHIPKGTTPSLRTGGSTNSGGLFYNTSDSSVYTYTGTQWIKLRGVIIDTTSLSNRINLKLNISDTASMLNPYLRKIDTTNKYVTQVYKKNASDSVFYVKGGNHIWAFNDSTGSPGGGGGGKVYYFNGGVSMGTISGLQMYELGDTANTGTAANFTRSTTGNIANFITDPGKPGLVQIPAGVWSVDAWLSETGGGANHAEIWIEVEKWDGSTITTIATSPIEQITEGSTPNLYSWSVSIPTTSLTVTDRIIIQFYISNTNGKTVTLYTQNGYVGEVHTTFTTGIGAINGLTAPAQYLVTGTSGTDFNINSATATHTFNLPTASATNRGALSSANWSTFNSKIGPSDTASMLSPYFRLAGVGLKNTGQTVYADTLLLSTRAWRQKGIDSVAALLPAAISGTTNYIPKFTSSSAIGNSQIFDNGTNVGINNTSPSFGYGTGLQITSALASNLRINTTGYTGLDIIGGANGDGYIYLRDNNPLIFGTNNTERLRISSTGNVSIGNTNNTYKLDVSGQLRAAATDAHILQVADGSAQLKLERTNSSTGAMYLGADNVGLKFFDASFNTRMTLDASGNLGLGVSPSAWGSNTVAIQLGGSVFGAVSASLRLLNLANAYTDGTDFRYINSGVAALQYRISGGTGAHEWYTAPSGTAGNAISFTQAMTLDASGRLGIGQTSPTFLLDLYRASNAIIRVLDGGTNNSLIMQAGSGTGMKITGYNYTTSTAVPVYISVDGANTILQSGGGSVGIGTTSPTEKLELSGTGNLYFRITATDASNAGVRFNAAGAREYGIFSDGALRFYDFTASAERMRITSGGNVGINTNSPTRLLDVNGVIRTQNAGSAGAPSIELGTSAQGNGLFYPTTNTIAISTNDTERMRITSGGEILVNTTSDAGDYKLQVNGNSYLNGVTKITKSVELPHTTKSAAYTLTSDDYTVGFDVTSASITATLPDATTCAGRIYVIYQYNTGIASRGVTIDGNGAQTINGIATYSLLGWCDYSSVILQSDGSNWIILSDAMQSGCL